MEALSKLPNRIITKLKSHRSVEYTDADAFFQDAANLIGNCRSELYLEGWIPKVDGREEMRLAFESALMNVTPVPFSSGPLQVKMMAIFEKDTPKVISDLMKKYSNRILVKEVSELGWKGCYMELLIDPSYVRNAVVKAVQSYSNKEGFSGMIQRDTLNLGLKLKRQFEREFYS